MRKKALVTGASGFIARYLIASLKEKGIEVIKFSRENNQQVVKSDDFEKLPEVQLVFHLAAVSGYKDSNENTLKAYEVNVGGTVNVLEYCRKVKAKLVFPSTYVYDKPYTDYKKEADATRTTTHYAFTKLLGEEVCQFYSRIFGVNTLILRTSNVYGLGQDEKYILPVITKHLLEKKPLMLTKPDIERTYIYVKDVVEAYIKLAEAETNPGEIYNVAGPKPTSLGELVEMIEEAGGIKGKISYSGQSRPNDIERNRLDISKIKKKVNWQPKISLEEGLRIYLTNLKSSKKP